MKILVLVRVARSSESFKHLQIGGICELRRTLDFMGSG